MVRKKKTDVIMSAEVAESMEMPGTIGGAKLVFQIGVPKIVKGNHLTVTTFPDGSTKLEWDDEALLRDVRDAILRHESNIPASSEDTPKLTRKKKEKANG